MKYVKQFVKGVPYSKDRNRGDKQAAPAWTEAVVNQTQSLPAVAEACILKVTFLLPPDKFPADYPYGPDLDNLLKRFLDALEKTVFSTSRGGDSCIISVQALKAKVESAAEAGAVLEIVPVSV